jgi:hypothetical protein
MQIEIDFDVFKELTALRNHESHTYNDVLRDLLKIDSLVEDAPPESPLQKASDALSRSVGTSGFYSKGLWLPNATLLRARYKQQEYRAKIVSDRWVDENEREHTSASAAASAITGTNVNGLRFWEAMRPSDTVWRRLELLRQA